MESCSIDTVHSGFQHSKFCTSLNTTPLKSFIILEILNFHQDLPEITNFLIFLVLFLYVFFFFFSLQGFQVHLPDNSILQTEPLAITSPFLSRTRWHTWEHYRAVTQPCQEPRAPGSCQATGNTCPHRSCHENKAWTCWKCKPGISCEHRNQGDYRAGEVLEILPGIATSTGDF